VEVENIILSNNEFSNIPLDIMKIPSLSKIIIDHNKIDDIDFKAIKALRMHKEITYVDLSYNKVLFLYFKTDEF
jgi:Leucine-rich repeat (LRR) protein